MKSGYTIFNRHSLFWKIYLSMIVMLSLPVLVFSVHRFLTRAEIQESRNSLVQNLQWSARLLANQAERLPIAEIETWRRNVQEDSGLELYIDKGGEVIYPPDAHWVQVYLSGELAPPPKGPLTAEARSQSGGTKVVVYLHPAVPPPPGGPFVRNVSFLIVATVGLIIAFLIVRSFMKPLEELRKITGRLADGDFSARAGEAVLAHGEEIADLGASFNWMAERVENVINVQKRLLVDISHEIRSPLQRMDVALTLARDKTRSDSDQYLDRVELEIERINEMVDELLTLTRAETSEKQPEPVRVDEILHALALDAEFEGQIQGKTITTRIEPVTVAGDASLLKRALGNVIYNAIRYAPPETKVEIESGCTPDGRSAAITVRDFGQGVHEDELDKIFLPYYRTDTARERPQGGTGLGLAITKRVVEGHEGSVSASHTPGGGLTVEIIIPLIPLSS